MHDANSAACSRTLTLSLTHSHTRFLAHLSHSPIGAQGPASSSHPKPKSSAAVLTASAAATAAEAQQPAKPPLRHTKPRSARSAPPAAPAAAGFNNVAGAAEKPGQKRHMPEVCPVLLALADTKTAEHILCRQSHFTARSKGVRSRTSAYVFWHHHNALQS